MGIALAAGFPPALGLVTAIVGAIVVGLLGGAPLQVAGPSAGLAVLVLQMVDEHGFAVFGVILLLAGALQLAAGVCKLGRYFRAVSPSVIRGMLTGFGVLIIAGQAHMMIDDAPKESGLESLRQIPGAIAKLFDLTTLGAHHEAAMVSFPALFVILMWDRFKPARARVIPGALLGTLVGMLIAFARGFRVDVITVPPDLLSIISAPSAEALAGFSAPGTYLAACALAFVATAETLLCATAVSQMHQGDRTNYDLELMAQGGANLILGFVGAMPVAGVISRSTVNVEAGASSRWSTVFHGVWILVVVLLAPTLLEYVPRAALAAILVAVGFRLLGIKAIRSLSRFGPSVMLVFAATLLGVVAVDLLTGILLGLGLSSARLLLRATRLSIERIDGGADRIEVHLSGSASFLSLPRLADVLEAIPADARVHFVLDELSFIDHSCIDLLSGFKQRREDLGHDVVLDLNALLSIREAGDERS